MVQFGQQMPMPFEFVIAGPPVSQQARRRDLRERWMREVRTAARDRWDADPPAEGSVAVTITYFFDDVELDVDNIPKPILDALEGLVYYDDSQVSDLLCRKRDLNDAPVFGSPSRDLLEYLADSKQVLHISVADALIREVTF